MPAEKNEKCRCNKETLKNSSLIYNVGLARYLSWYKYSNGSGHSHGHGPSPGFCSFTVWEICETDFALNIWICVTLLRVAIKGDWPGIAGENGRIDSHLSLLWPLQTSICGLWNNKIHSNAESWYLGKVSKKCPFTMPLLLGCQCFDCMHFIPSFLHVYGMIPIQALTRLVQRPKKLMMNYWHLTWTLLWIWLYMYEADVAGFLGCPPFFCHT